MGGTACKVPNAVEYIAKVEKMGRLGKKRKTAMCLIAGYNDRATLRCFNRCQELSNHPFSETHIPRRMADPWPKLIGIGC